MEYIFRTGNACDFKGKIILVNECLGCSCDFLIRELANAFKSHAVVSFYLKKEEYQGLNSFSAYDLEQEDLKRVVNFLDSDLLLVDGNNLKNFDLDFGSSNFENKTVVLINRSVATLCYSEMYRAHTVVTLRALLASSSIYSGRLNIRTRATMEDIDLLYTETDGKTEYLVDEAGTASLPPQ